MGQVAPETALGVVGDPGVAGPADVSPVQVDLVDGLRRPDPAQLLGPVGGDDEHRDLRQPGLDDGREEVGRRRAARAQQERRSTVESEAERDESGDTLVVHDVDAQLRLDRRSPGPAASNVNPAR